MRGAPHSGLSRLNLRMSWRVSAGTVGTTKSAPARLPGQAETFAMPSDHRFRLDDNQGTIANGSRLRITNPTAVDQLR